MMRDPGMISRQRKAAGIGPQAERRRR